MIAKGLMGIAARLGEKHDLRGYFAQCERQRITPSGSRPGVLPFAVDHNSSFNNLPLDTEVPLDNSIWRCPQAYLGSVVSGAPVHVNAKAALEYDGPLDFDSDTDDEHVDEGLEPRFNLELRVKCIPTLDIYVALSPSGPAGSVIPTLIVQPRTRIKPDSNLSEGPDRSAIFDDRFTLGEHHGHPSPAVKEHKSRHNLISLSNNYLQEAVPERELVTPKLASYFYGSRSIFRLQRSWLGWVIKELIVGPGVIPHLVPDSFREPSTTLHVASAQNILHLLTKEMFFRHHESSYLDASPAGWTDERQDEAGDLYFLPSSEATADAKPTMASARTLLSRLERWMCGDLVVPEGADIAPGKLEDELDRRAKALVSAAKAAREEAAERLSTVLVEPAKEPAAGAETKPDPA